MDIKTYLAEQGLTPEEIAAVVGNEKTSKAMTAALAKYDEGVTLSTKAQTDLEAANAAKKDAEDFWEQKVTPALAGVDGKVALANAEAARYREYLASLRTQGYEVPEALLPKDGSKPTTTTTTTTTPNAFTREDFQKEMQGTSETLISLMGLSNEYQDLYGAPYLSADQDFAEAKNAKKPFRDFVRGKYKFDDKRKEKSAAAEQARIDKIVEEKTKAKEAELQAKYGSNPETRTPLASRFDKLEKRNEGKEDSWKSKSGRETAKKDRLSRFENVIQ